MLRILTVTLLALSVASVAPVIAAEQMDAWLHKADTLKTATWPWPEQQRARQVLPKMTQGSADEMDVPYGSTSPGSTLTYEIKPQPAIKPHVVVLVSFSLPDTALQSLYQQLQPVQGQLVFRGAPANNLQLMQQRLQRLQIRAEIDPWWFRYLQVTQVPAFVLLPSSWHRGRSHPGDAVLLTGLVDIRTALDFMGRNSSDQRVQVAVTELLGRLSHD
ncbi:MAG: hypothetical protein HKM02_00485 [Pseudomonadales bacterium]|nr:hypothetical protein [Pseudomonadales bacterium]